jgi:hypothetical protein
MYLILCPSTCPNFIRRMPMTSKGFFGVFSTIVIALDSICIYENCEVLNIIWCNTFNYMLSLQPFICNIYRNNRLQKSQYFFYKLHIFKACGILALVVLQFIGKLILKACAKSSPKAHYHYLLILIQFHTFYKWFSEYLQVFWRFPSFPSFYLHFEMFCFA